MDAANKPLQSHCLGVHWPGEPNVRLSDPCTQLGGGGGAGDAWDWASTLDTLCREVGGKPGGGATPETEGPGGEQAGGAGGRSLDRGHCTARREGRQPEAEQRRPRTARASRGAPAEAQTALLGAGVPAGPCSQRTQSGCWHRWGGGDGAWGRLCGVRGAWERLGGVVHVEDRWGLCREAGQREPWGQPAGDTMRGTGGGAGEERVWQRRGEAPPECWHRPRPRASLPLRLPSVSTYKPCPTYPNDALCLGFTHPQNQGHWGGPHCLTTASVQP